MADVSSNNGSIDLDAYANAGHVAIAIKATEGTNYTNPAHPSWCNWAHRRGLTVCHYHFARPSRRNITAEVDLFHRISRRAWRAGDYLVLDLEKQEGGSPANYADRFLEQLKPLGHPLVLYTYRAFWNEHRLATVRLPGGRVWMADYSEPLSNEHHWAKQYTDGEQGPLPHHYAGIGDCDGSVLNPTTAALLHVRKIRTGRRP